MSERNNIAITFAGDVYVKLTADEARRVQRVHGGCIRGHNEPKSDLIKSFIETVQTFHTEAETMELLKDFELYLKSI